MFFIVPSFSILLASYLFKINKQTIETTIKVASVAQRYYERINKKDTKIQIDKNYDIGFLVIDIATGRAFEISVDSEN